MGRGRYGVREEVRDAAEAFYRAISTRNLKAIHAIWAHEPYACVAGPVGHLHQGWEQVAHFWEERFQQLSGMQISAKLDRLLVHAVGDIAWFSGVERRIISRDDHVWHEELRVTSVLERKGSGWQIVSYHASEPAQEPTAALLNQPESLASIS